MSYVRIREQSVFWSFPSDISDDSCENLRAHQVRWEKKKVVIFKSLQKGTENVMFGDPT